MTIITHMKTKKRKKIVSPNGNTGLISHRDLVRQGLHPQQIKRMYQKGILKKITRGLYSTTEATTGEYHDVAVVASRIPQGVICLISALQVHGLTTQIPHEIWIAIARRAATPRLDYPPVRLIRLAKAGLSAGIETRIFEGKKVKIFTVAKTVADCFKFRNKIGLDVAIEALKDYLRLKKGTVDELWHFAKINRVAKVIQPYLEASV